MKNISLLNISKSTLALLTSGAVTGVADSALLSTAAAANPSCGSGATRIATNICEVTFNSSGTWTPPTGISTAQALLVGGGGDGSGVSTLNGYGGGGGAVEVVTLHNTGQVAITVGAAAANSVAVQGVTTYTAAGGASASGTGGTSGNGNTGALGGGGAGAASTTVDSGAGVIVSAIAPVGSLFANDSNCYGGGGAGYDSAPTFGTPSCGAGSISSGTGHPSASTPNSGAGGSASDHDYATGASGVVVIRYSLASPAAVYFAPSSAVLTSAAKSTIDTFANRLIAWGITAARINGYTDPRGTLASNHALATKRAQAVIAYLHHKLQVLGSTNVSLTAVGVGPTRTGATYALDRKATLNQP